ncbi:hypothetical protein MBLNU230_g3366t1 [Neophaeotheca triangularis]
MISAPSLTTTLTFLSTPAFASYGFYVGKNLTSSGSVLLGGTGEEVSSHWLQLFPAVDHAPNATIQVGVTADAAIPGELISIPQAAHTLRYLSMEYSDYEGFPAPLTNGGVNECGVGVRDIWAPNREELVAMTPTPQRGVQYSDLARIVMERASTARQGVEMIGDFIARYGYATYGGNSHLIADADEGWVVWEFAGGRGLWAAERLGPNHVRVSYPGYIEEFPLDFAENPDYMGSDDIVSFAVEAGWFDPSGNETFNIFNVYGLQDDGYRARTGGFKYVSQAELEEATLAMAPVSEQDLMQRVRDPRIADDEAGYGQVVSLRGGLEADLIRLWVAPTGSVTAPFLPWWLGVDSVPAEFGQHRYLTKDAGSTFLSANYQLQEATRFAGRVYKQVLYYTCSAPQTLLPVVTEMLEGFEAESRVDLAWVEKSARTLIEAGQRELAHSVLTHYSHSRARDAMELGESLIGTLDAYIKLTGRWRDPVGDEINDPGEGAETVNCLAGFDPDVPRDQQVLKK